MDDPNFTKNIILLKMKRTSVFNETAIHLDFLEPTSFCQENLITAVLLAKYSGRYYYLFHLNADIET